MRVIFVVFEDFRPPKSVQSWLSCVAQLLSYRRGEHDPASQLTGLPPQLRRMILHMIQLDPGAQLASPPATVPRSTAGRVVGFRGFGFGFGFGQARLLFSHSLRGTATGSYLGHARSRRATARRGRLPAAVWAAAVPALLFGPAAPFPGDSSHPGSGRARRRHRGQLRQPCRGAACSPKA